MREILENSEQVNTRQTYYMPTAHNIERHMADVLKGNVCKKGGKTAFEKMDIFYTVSNSVQSIERETFTCDIIFKCKL